MMKYTIEEKEYLYTQLLNVPHEKLVAEMIDFAYLNEDARGLVERLVLPSKRLEENFYDRMGAFLHSGKFYKYDELHLVSSKLNMFLNDIRAIAKKPLDGVILCLALYKIDGEIFDMGSIRGTFRYWPKSNDLNLID